MATSAVSRIFLLITVGCLPEQCAGHRRLAQRPPAAVRQGKMRHMTAPVVTAVSRSSAHTFSKPNEPAITLIAGLGVEGDAHAGVTIRHRSRVRRDPTKPNLRQVHL